MKLFIFIIATILTGSSFAANRNYENIFDQAAYEFVKNSCQDLSYEVPRYFQSRTYDLTLGLNLNTIKKEFVSLNDGDHIGISHRLNRMLNTFGYYEALRECFPNDESARNRYTMKLIALDLGGTLEAVALSVGGGWAIGKGMTKLTAWGFKKMGFSVFKQRLILAGVSVPFVAEAGYEAYKDKKDSEEAAALNQKVDLQTLEFMTGRWDKYNRIKEEIQNTPSSNSFKLETLNMISDSIKGELQTYCDQLKYIKIKNQTYSKLLNNCRKKL